jgi:hypothetical protein
MQLFSIRPKNKKGLVREVVEAVPISGKSYFSPGLIIGIAKKRNGNNFDVYKIVTFFHKIKVNRQNFSSVATCRNIVK